MHDQSRRPSRTVSGLSLIAGAFLTACSMGGTTPGASPSVSPTATPAPSTTPLPATPSPQSDHVDHPTGPTDVVLRVESGGGFIPFGYMVTQAPMFTLYGDNSVIFRPTSDAQGAGLPPFVKAVLSADQADAVLDFALTDGHLKTAGASYSVPNVADAPTTYFTLNAASLPKFVSVYALGIVTANTGADAADFQAFAELNTFLANFDKEVAKGHVVSAETFLPAHYRAVLMPATDLHSPKAWPWQDLKVADFPIDPGNPARRMALINVDQAAKVTSVPSGGVLGLGILSADGTRQFSLSLRPMLPGDTLQPQNLP